MSWDKVRRDLAELERKKLFRFAYPDGSITELPWTDASTAKTWANIVGHRYLGEVPSTAVPPTNRGTGDRGLSPPPLIQAERAPGSLEIADLRATHLGPETIKRKTYADIGQPISRPSPPPPEPPPEKKRPEPPPPSDEEYTLWKYITEDGLHTTMTESMLLTSKWFGIFGKAMEKVPGLQGVGKAYQAIGEIAAGLNLVYELVHEVNQAEALEKGSKQLIKRTKPVKRIAEALLKKKYPNVPEGARKKAAEYLEFLFEKYGSDPAIKKGRKKAQELDESNDLDKSLFQQLKKLLESPPVLSPTP